MDQIRTTPSQTVGPFFAYSLTAEQYGYDYNSIINGSLINEDAAGERICITGNIFDGNGNTVPDAIIELYHADGNGQNRVHPIAKRGSLTVARFSEAMAPSRSFLASAIWPR